MSRLYHLIREWLIRERMQKGVLPVVLVCGGGDVVQELVGLRMREVVVDCAWAWAGLVPGEYQVLASVIC